MKSEPLKKLTVRHLRGALQPISINFSPSKKITVVYGENGSGKTTICDAFDLLGNEIVGSLEDRGLGRTQRYWPSIGNAPAALRVDLETTSGTCTVRMNGSAVQVGPRALQPRVLLLRRRQLTGLLEGAPADRFKRIQDFVAVANFENSEAALRNLITSLGKGRDASVAAIAENHASLEASWKTAGGRGKDAVAWARTVVSPDNERIGRENAALDQLRTHLSSIVALGEKVESASSLVATARERFAEATATLKRAEEHDAEGTSDLLRVLQAATAYFEHHPDPAECPLCQSSERVLDLAANVAMRVASLDDIQVALSSVVDRRDELNSAELGLRLLATDIGAASARLVAAGEDPHLPHGTLLPARPCPAEIPRVGPWLVDMGPLKTTWDQEAKARGEVATLRANLRQALESLTSKTDEQRSLEELIPAAESALSILEDERRLFVDGVLGGIASEVGRLYELVHPAEGLNTVALELDPAKRASLDVNVSFVGKSVPPGAYFSQSHLDTLGLCVFLALAKREAPAETILVLDDILASVDEPHVDRLIEMIYGESQCFRHCILTTHYRPWREKLRWGFHKNDECHFVELRRWCPSTGMSLTGSLPELELLRAALAANQPDPQLISSKAGVILEAALDFLTQLYECRVPRRASGRYAIGDLLLALDNKLRDALRVEVASGVDGEGKKLFTSESLTTRIKDLERIAQVRNLTGAHFSEIGMMLPAEDAIRFGTCVIELMDLLTHPDEGWPRSKKSGSYWATSRDSRRLHPLLRPQ